MTCCVRTSCLFFFQIRLLAEKKSGVKQEINNLKKEPKSSSYTSPWSEAIATSGMPKIPKINKVQVNNTSHVHM